ncbi:MAG: hypothetical protein AAFY88_14300 [Acidobacteriota bacterium]
MSRQTDESVGALLGALQQLRRSGAFSEETLEAALQRVDGDMDVWIRDPDSVTMVEALTLLEAIGAGSSPAPDERLVYDSLTAPTPGRPMTNEAAVVGTVEGGLTHIADRLLAAAFLIFKASPLPVDAKLDTLTALVERQAKEHFDLDVVAELSTPDADAS